MNPELERLWLFLKNRPELAGFVLIGGTALALQIHHRRSEDLDLAYPELRLPTARLQLLLRAAGDLGFNFQPDDDEAAVEEFSSAGMELNDYQQNFAVNNMVKVSFFTPDRVLASVLSTSKDQRVRLATLAELFKTKCLVSAVRSKTRDWLDLYVLIRDHGFSIRQFADVFEQAGVPAQRDTALSRLCSGIPQADDEGYMHLMERPPSVAEIQEFFNQQRTRLEIESAREALRQRRSGPNSGRT